MPHQLPASAKPYAFIPHKVSRRDIEEENQQKRPEKKISKSHMQHLFHSQVTQEESLKDLLHMWLPHNFSGGCHLKYA